MKIAGRKNIPLNGEQWPIYSQLHRLVFPFVRLILSNQSYATETRGLRVVTFLQKMDALAGLLPQLSQRSDEQRLPLNIHHVNKPNND